MVLIQALHNIQCLFCREAKSSVGISLQFCQVIYCLLYTSSYVEMLFSSASMSEFLNKAEFISAVSEYDRNRLKELVDAQNAVAEKEKQLQTEQSQLTKLQDELNQKQADLTAKDVYKRQVYPRHASKMCAPSSIKRDSSVLLNLNTDNGHFTIPTSTSSKFLIVNVSSIGAFAIANV